MNQCTTKSDSCTVSYKYVLCNRTRLNFQRFTWTGIPQNSRRSEMWRQPYKHLYTPNRANAHKTHVELQVEGSERYLYSGRKEGSKADQGRERKRGKSRESRSMLRLFARNVMYVHRNVKHTRKLGLIGSTATAVLEFI